MAQASDATPLDWRGSDISHRYRQLPVDSVPTDLDRLILEQARAAVGAPAPPHRTWIRWGLPLGLIGSAVLAATLVFDGARPPRQPSTAQTQISPTERPERTDVVESSTARLPTGASSRAPQPTLAPATQPRPVAPAIAPQRGESVPASVQISAPVAVSTPSQPQAAVVATLAPEPAVAAATVSELPLQAAPLSAAAAEPLEQSAGTAAVETSAQTEPASQSPFEELDALQLSTTSPVKDAAAEDRLEDIRYLRQTGRNRRADYEWRKFIEDFPKYPVAADDLARPRAK
jgi:hypothetical protein